MDKKLSCEQVFHLHHLVSYGPQGALPRQMVLDHYGAGEDRAPGLLRGDIQHAARFLSKLLSLGLAEYCDGIVSLHLAADSRRYRATASGIAKSAEFKSTETDSAEPSRTPQ